MFKIWLLSVFIFYIALPIASKDRIGVMDFTESDGLPVGIGKLAATHAIMSLLESRKYTVIEKSTVDFILKEQALQQKGCTDTECAINTGKLIAANLMLTGNIIRLNEKIILSLNIRNLELGKVEFSETVSILNLTDLESTIVDSINRFTTKEKKISTELSFELTRSQQEALALSYICPGLGHISSGQITKGVFFASAFLYSAHNFFTIVPSVAWDSKRDIIQAYRGAILGLGTINTSSVDGANSAGAVFGTIYQDQLRRENMIHDRTLNSVYYLLASWIIIHTDLHVSILNNHFSKYFKHIYLKMSFEKIPYINWNFESKDSNPRYEFIITWGF